MNWKVQITELTAIAEALLRFDNGKAARLDWNALFADWNTPGRNRYIHRLEEMATSVACPEGRHGCYQEVRENAETGEFRAICSREDEVCARRTISRRGVKVWELDVKAMCQDIVDSLDTGANVYEHEFGIWECGKLRLGPGQYAGILFVIGGNGYDQRLENACRVYNGAGIIVPSIRLSNKATLAICEQAGNRAIVFGLEEHCRVDTSGKMAANKNEFLDRLPAVIGTGIKMHCWTATGDGLNRGGVPITMHNEPLGLLHSLERRGTDNTAEDNYKTWGFVDEGATYRITMPEGDFTIPKNTGEKYLYWFAKNPRTEKRALQIVTEVRGQGEQKVAADWDSDHAVQSPNATGVHIDSITTTETLRKYRERLKDIAIERARATTDGDQERLNTLDEESHQIEIQIQKDTGIGGKIRLMANDDKKAEESIKKAIQRAYAKVLKEKGSKTVRKVFVEEFKENLHFGFVCSYRRPKEQDWAVMK